MLTKERTLWKLPTDLFFHDSVGFLLFLLFYLVALVVHGGVCLIVSFRYIISFACFGTWRKGGMIFLQRMTHPLFFRITLAAGYKF